MQPALLRTTTQIRAAQAGDRAALEDLFARYLGWVRQTVALRLGYALRHRADLEDLVQESLLDAFRSIGTLELRAEGSFRHWLATIVANNVRDHLRRQQRGHAALRVATPSDTTRLTGSVLACAARDATPSQMAQAAELHERIEAALLALAPVHREIVILRDRCDMDYDEIAQHLGYKNADTARALYHRAIRLLEDALRRPASDGDCTRSLGAP